MTKKYIMEHIPRTLFAVKYNLDTDSKTTIMNKYKFCPTKKSQEKLVITLQNKQGYSEVKPIRWHINANDEKE